MQGRFNEWSRCRVGSMSGCRCRVGSMSGCRCRVGSMSGAGAG